MGKKNRQELNEKAFTLNLRCNLTATGFKDASIFVQILTLMQDCQSKIRQ